MKQNTHLEESLQLAYKGMESAALATDDATHSREFRVGFFLLDHKRFVYWCIVKEYMAQLKKENEGLRAVLRNGPAIDR